MTCSQRCLNYVCWKTNTLRQFKGIIFVARALARTSQNLIVTSEHSALKEVPGLGNFQNKPFH
jgi:hypothetical protein